MTPTTTTAPWPDPDTDRRSGPRWGRIVSGLLLVAGGAGWLLAGLAVAVPWQLVPACGLVLVGAVLLLQEFDLLVLRWSTVLPAIVVTIGVVTLLAGAVGAHRSRRAP